MQNMSWGRLAGGTFVLSLQMQWKHQICASELFDGMVGPFTEKTLRAMQNAVPLYETLPSSHAEYSTHPSLSSPSCSAWMGNVPNVDSAPACFLRLGLLAALVHAHDMEGLVLGW